MENQKNMQSHIENNSSKFQLWLTANPKNPGLA